MCKHVVDNGNGIIWECTKGNHNDAMHKMRPIHVDEPIPFEVSEFNTENTAHYNRDEYVLTVRIWQAWMFALGMMILAVIVMSKVVN